MLDLRVAGDARPLAASLAAVLADPLEDPMAAEWVAVPTEGMVRWLRLELARVLGSSGPGFEDGVCANLSFATPGALRALVLAAASAREGGEAPDPWRADRLVWAVLEAVRSSPGDERLGPLGFLPAGASWWGRARRVADLFDRYSTRRPELVRHWRAGRDVDSAGRGLPPGDAWQPHLWRLVRALLGTPSPAERLPELLEQVREGSLGLDLPARLAVFGITTLPGGPGFLELLDAISRRRDVHCYLLDPSEVASARVARLAGGASARGLARGEDPSARAVRHPLLASWGRPYRERAVLLAEAVRLGRVPAPRVEPPPGRHGAAGTLLEQVQRDLREDRPPDATFTPRPDDRSVQLHACHGRTRQVEVARDAILHLLADDPTLEEHDVLVVCPALGELAPVVAAVFGTPAGELGEGPADGGGPPALSYRIADRSLRETYPVLAALDSVLELLAGRFSASAVAEVLALSPVRERFGFDDQALATIGRWIADANVRWGLDGEHRERWGLPGQLATGTWREGVDRVLLGVAVGDGELELAVGPIAPVAVEGGDIELAGRFADALARLRELASACERPMTAARWAATLGAALDGLVATAPDEQWQRSRANELLAELGGATVGGRPSAVEITLADVRRALGDRLSGIPRRPDFFRGGVTVSSLAPLRFVPFRVVCILGLDDASPTASAPEGDDLAAASPRLGDPDARAEHRQSLLEAVLVAGDALVVTRTGRDERTNQPVPPSVAYAELRDVVAATVAPRDGDHGPGAEVVHPRQAFDERCLLPGRLGTAGPWSFDRGALASAHARRARVAARPWLLDAPLPPADHDSPVVTVAELASFLRGPVRTFFSSRLAIRVPEAGEPLRDEIGTSLAGLDRWLAAERLVGARRSGVADDRWARHERGLGTIPPGGLGELATRSLASDVDELFAALASLGCEPGDDPSRRVELDIALPDGGRVVGEVARSGSTERPGPTRLTYTRARAAHHLEAALELALLVASSPQTPWRAVTVRRGTQRSPVDALVLEAADEHPAARRHAAVRVLEVVADCRRRALREPIPLWPSLSRALCDGTARPSEWRARNGEGEGEGDDAYTQLAFGARTLEEIRSLPARSDDPPGEAPGRAERYARYLWGAIDDFARPVAAGGSGPAGATGRSPGARGPRRARPSGGAAQ